MFRAIILPIFRSPRLCITACGTGRQHRRCIIPQAVTHSLVLLKMGKIISRNMFELTGIINKPLLLHLVGCLYYLYQWCTLKQISDNETYLLIKYIKSVLWRVAKRLSYREEARCLKVKEHDAGSSFESLYQDFSVYEWWLCWVWQRRLWFIRRLVQGEFLVKKIGTGIGFSSSTWTFIFQYLSTNAPYSFTRHRLQINDTTTDLDLRTLYRATGIGYLARSLRHWSTVFISAFSLTHWGRGF